MALAIFFYIDKIGKYQYIDLRSLHKRSDDGR